MVHFQTVVMTSSSSSQLTGDLPPIPIELGGSDDASTFVGLDLALRSTSDLLRREGSHNLSPKALSNITSGMRWFQDFHLGKDATGLRWPIVRIPDKIFLDRNRGGPLFTALLSAFRYKSTQSWRSFDFKNPKRFDDNIALFKKMERDLKAAGYITWPTIYFDDNIPQANLANLKRLAIRFGASIVQNPTKASHIVAHDSEEMDTDEDLRKEEERDNSGDSPDRTYLRTMAIVNVDKTSTNTSKQSSSSSSKKRSHAMALVHWWFWPTSADEWISASDVDGVPDNEKNSPNGPDDKTWIVSCKFVRDVALFNEWGLEMDYIIMDYEKKVNLFTDPAKWKMFESTTSVAVKKNGNKNLRAKSHNGDDLENSISDRKDSYSISSVVVNSHTDSLSIATTIKPNSTNSINKPGHIRDLDNRRGGNGMNPRIIQTRAIVPSYEKLNTIVFDGALRIAPTARKMMENYAIQNSSSPNTPFHLYKDLTGIKGPSMDETLHSIVVTELSESKTHINKTVAVNKQVWKEVQLQRIRGGGEETEENKNTVNSGHKTKGNDVANASLIDSDSFTTLTSKTEPGNATKNNALSGNEHSSTSPVSMSKLNTAFSNSSEQTLNENIPQLSEMDNIALSTNMSKGQQEISSPNTSCYGNDKNVANVPFKSGTSYDISIQASIHVQHKSTVPTKSTEDARRHLQGINPSGTLSNSLSILNEATQNQITESKENQASGKEISPKASSVTSPLTTESKVSTSNIQTRLPIIGNNLEKRHPIVVSGVKSQTTKGSSLTARLLSSVPKVVPFPNNSVPLKNNLPSLPSNATKNGTTVTSTKPMDSRLASEIVQSKPSPTLSDNVQSKGLLPNAPLQSMKSLIVDNNIHSLPTTSLAAKHMPFQPNTLPPSQMTPAQPPSSSSSVAIEETIYAPKWYNKSIPSQFEKQMLPEWFNGSASHRTSSNYVLIRNGIMNMVKTNPNRFITATAVRKSFAGDAGSLLRLHSFLMTWGMINTNTVGDSMPSSTMSTCQWGKPSFLGENNVSLLDQNNYDFHSSNNHDWTDSDRTTLTHSVVHHIQKKTKATCW